VPDTTNKGILSLTISSSNTRGNDGFVMGFT